MIVNSLGQSKQQDSGETRRRLCDFCGESTALLYCRADSAKLCLVCDREVHSTNPLFTKHTRWLLCDACDSIPATIFCCTDTSVLCQNCDWESHSLHTLTSAHDRRPLEGFTGCPSVTELLAIFGFEHVSKKALLIGDDASAPDALGDGENNNDHRNNKSVSDEDDSSYGISDFLVWETPSFVSLDDLIVSNSSADGHNFQAMGFPPLPKNRNTTCGQHKEEVLCQLREMSKLEPDFGDSQEDVEAFIGFQSVLPRPEHQFGEKDSRLDHKREPTLVPSYEWCGNTDEAADFGFPSPSLGNNIEMNHLVPGKDSDIGDSSGHVNGSHEEQSHPPVVSESLQILPRVSARELNRQERDSALSRYKEKKKTRRYDKHIRYESRKVRAQTRIRIRGRFAKMVQ